MGFLPTSGNRVGAGNVDGSAECAARVEVAALGKSACNGVGSRHIECVGAAGSLGRLADCRTAFHIPCHLGSNGIVAFLDVDGVRQSNGSARVHGLREIIAGFHSPVDQLALGATMVVPIVQIPAVGLAFLSRIMHFDGAVLTDGQRQPNIGGIGFTGIPTVTKVDEVTFLLVYCEHTSRLRTECGAAGIAHRQQTIRAFRHVVVPRVLVGIVLFHATGPASQHGVGGVVGLLVRVPAGCTRCDDVVTPVILEYGRSFQRTILFDDLEIFATHRGIRSTVCKNVWVLPVSRVLLLSLGLVHIRGLDYIGVIIVKLGDVQRGIGFGRIQHIGTVVLRIHEHSHIAAVTVLTPAGVTCGFFPIVLVRQTIGTHHSERARRIVGNSHARKCTCIVGTARRGASIGMPPQHVLLVLLVVDDLRTLENALYGINRAITILIGVGVEVREDCVGLGSVHTAVGLGQVVGLVEVGVIGIALIRQLRFAGHRTQRHTKIGPVV